jgi:hypothetical protein
MRRTQGRGCELSGVGFFKEAYITVKPFGKRAILLVG